MRTWVDKMDPNGNDPKFSDVIRKLWFTEDGVFTGSRPAAYVEDYEILSKDESSKGLTLVQRWIKACKGDQSGKAFGLGEEGAALLSYGMSSDKVAYKFQNEGLITMQLQEMKTTQAAMESAMREYKKEMQRQLEEQRTVMREL